MPQPTRPPTPPILVEDIEDLLRLGRERLEEQGYKPDAYTEAFTWRKTDIAPSPGGAITASRAVLSGDCRAIGGWSFAETTNAAPAALRLHDGNSAGGEVLLRINLATNESTRDFIPKHGIRVFTGRVYIEILSGSVEGVIYWR